MRRVPLFTRVLATALLAFLATMVYRRKSAMN
jgi:hypothetical protein